jgi:hypothetical protein
MGKKTLPLCDAYTLDPTRTLDDVLFMITVHWIETWTRGKIGDRFGKTAHWTDKHLRTVYNKLDVHCVQGLLPKGREMGIFTDINTAPDAVWRNHQYVHKDGRFVRVK